jgi:hypothetical protein
MATTPWETSSRERGNWARNDVSFCQQWWIPRHWRDLLHGTNLLHGNDGFTSPLKEGMLRIFLPWKIRPLRPGLNLRTWVPEASMLPQTTEATILWVGCAQAQLTALYVKLLKIMEFMHKGTVWNKDSSPLIQGDQKVSVHLMITV